MTNSKPKIIRDISKLDERLIELVQKEYPHGFEGEVISFRNAKNELVKAIQVEDEEAIYLIKLPRDDEGNAITEYDFDDDEEENDDDLVADEIEPDDMEEDNFEEDEDSEDEKED